MTEHTTILHLRHVTFAHEGRYQCIITNHFGSTYSSKARLIVNGGFTGWFPFGALALLTGAFYGKFDTALLSLGLKLNYGAVVRRNHNLLLLHVVTSLAIAELP